MTRFIANAFYWIEKRVVNGAQPYLQSGVLESMHGNMSGRRCAPTTPSNQKGTYDQ
jgi:hypothetical protein